MSKKLSMALATVAIVAIFAVIIDERIRHGHSRTDIAAGFSLGANGYTHVVLGLLIGALALMLARAIRADGIKRTSATILGLGAVGCVCAGVHSLFYPVDYRAHAFGLHFWLSVFVGMTIPAALLVLSNDLRGPGVKDWKRVAPWTVAAAIAACAAFIRPLLMPVPYVLRHAPLNAFVLGRAELIVLLVWAAAVAGWMWKKSSPHTERGKIEWEAISKKIEVFSLPLVLLGGLIALLEYYEGHKRDRRETAAAAYEKADEKWTEFLKLCIEHPDADCYGGEAVEPFDMKGPDGIKRRLVLEYLIDTLEVAYVNYNDADYAAYAPDEYCRQWSTWVVAIRKFANRRPFRVVWSQVGNEYDTKYQACVNAVIHEQTGLGPWEADRDSRSVGLLPFIKYPIRGLQDAQMPDECQLYICENQ